MKWEYKILRSLLFFGKIEEQENEMGQEGWELIAVRNDLLYFKRPKSERDLKEDFSEGIERVVRKNIYP